jgi:hypothetical protein
VIHAPSHFMGRVQYRVSNLQIPTFILELANFKFQIQAPSPKFQFQSPVPVPSLKFQFQVPVPSSSSKFRVPDPVPVPSPNAVASTIRAMLIHHSRGRDRR